MDIQRVAKFQRLLIWAILANVAFYAASVALNVTAKQAADSDAVGVALAAGGAAGLTGLIGLGVGIYSLVIVLLLMSAMRAGVVKCVLTAFLLLIPLIGLLVLIHINGRATSVLRSNGVPVGLMGAKI